MFTWFFWKAILERSTKTFAQSLAAQLTVVGLTVGIHQVDWLMLLSISALAAVASLVTSVGTAGATNGSPSLGNSETLRQG